MISDIFSVNIQRLPVWLVPAFLQKARMMAWLYSLMAPFAVLKDEFSTWRSEKNYSIMLTGQRIYLEKLLNDRFDNAQRRIYLENSTPSSPEFAYNVVESAIGYYQYNAYDEEVAYNDNDYCAFESLIYQYDSNVVDNSFRLIDFENAIKSTYDLELVYFNSQSFFVRDAIVFNSASVAGTSDVALGVRSLSMKGTTLALLETAQAIYNLKKLSFYHYKHSSAEEIDWVVEVFYENWDTELPPDPADGFFFGEIVLPTRNYQLLGSFRPTDGWNYLEFDIEYPRFSHFRIRPLSNSSDANYRVNIDNIRLDFDNPPPGFYDYFTQVNDMHFMRNIIEYLSEVDFNIYTPLLTTYQKLLLERLVRQYSIATKKFNVLEI